MEGARPRRRCCHVPHLGPRPDVDRHLLRDARVPEQSAEATPKTQETLLKFNLTCLLTEQEQVHLAVASLEPVDLQG